LGEKVFAHSADTWPFVKKMAETMIILVERAWERVAIIFLEFFIFPSGRGRSLAKHGLWDFDIPTTAMKIRLLEDMAW